MGKREKRTQRELGGGGGDRTKISSLRSRSNKIRSQEWGGACVLKGVSRRTLRPQTVGVKGGCVTVWAGYVRVMNSVSLKTKRPLTFGFSRGKATDLFKTETKGGFGRGGALRHRGGVYMK